MNITRRFLSAVTAAGIAAGAFALLVSASKLSGSADNIGSTPLMMTSTPAPVSL